MTLLLLKNLIFVVVFGVQSVLLVSSKQKAFSKLKFRNSPAVAPFDSRTGREDVSVLFEFTRKLQKIFD